MKDNKEKKNSPKYLGILGLSLILLFSVIADCNRTGVTDSVIPEVTSTNPADNAKGVALDVTVTATFSEEMDTTTFNTTSFSLELDSSSVPGSVTFTPTTATFIPFNNLLSNRIYTATITTKVKDAMGYSLPENYEWRFSTVGNDGTNIEILSTNPSGHSEDVSVSTSVTAVFSEVMEPSTVNAETFTLRQGTSLVPGSVSSNDNTSAFTPSENLDSGTTYTATVTKDAESVNGYSLAENYNWSFTTLENSNDAPPEVNSTDPGNNAGNVGVNTVISATFSEEMNASTLNTETFTLRQGLFSVDGSIEYSGRTATFTPENNLENDETYTAAITEEVEDLEGNRLESDYEWEFSTESNRDDESPEIDDTDPDDKDEDVDLDAEITVTFSEAMNPSTINAETFRIMEDGPGNSLRTVEGSVSYSGFTATFTPSGNLDDDEKYFAIVTTDVEDEAGNEMEKDYEWEFRTKDDDDDDNVSPEIIDTDPEGNDKDVDLDAEITVTFSEAMDPSTINTETFRITEDGRGNNSETVEGSVSYSGFTATFTPSENLDEDEKYFAIVTTDVEDEAGNEMEKDYEWEFRTEDDDDD